MKKRSDSTFILQAVFVSTRTNGMRKAMDTFFEENTDSHLLVNAESEDYRTCILGPDQEVMTLIGFMAANGPGSLVSARRVMQAG